MYWTMAQVGIGDPPSLPAVDFPIDIASVATEVVTGAGLIIVLVYSTAVGFVMAWKLYRRIRTGAVG